MNCPICASTEEPKQLCKVNLIYKTDFDLVECNECKLKYFSPIPEPAQLSKFYSRLHYQHDPWRQAAKADYYISRLLKQNKSGIILDIGCAAGFFLHRISETTDWKVKGVELAEQPSQYARDILGLDVVTGELFSAKFSDNAFDAIHIGDVLEHVPNPLEFIKECRRILKPDGRIYLAVPNGFIDSKGLIHYYKEENRAGRHASGHIFFFEKKTLYKLFDITGFKTTYEYTISIKNGLRALGYFPQRRKWKSFYLPSSEPEKLCTLEIPAIPKQPHSDFYYKYHFYKKIVFGLSGLRSAGNDYLIEFDIDETINKPSGSETF
jgi:2-polyprenyl-3-methyl-5-hydroxy-6-metoxy-1,4-benzoquinol methylase